jgi:hypothetical protein
MELEARVETDSTLETPYMKLWIKDKIIYCDYTKGIDISLSIAKLCIAQRIEFSKGKEYPACVFVKNINSVEKAARKCFAEEGAFLIKACALIIDSPLSQVLSNFFLYINKPNVPTRLFTETKLAEKWLRIYV